MGLGTAIYVESATSVLLVTVVFVVGVFDSSGLVYVGILGSFFFNIPPDIDDEDSEEVVVVFWSDD